MKILFFSHYFPPEGNAPASRTYEHCVRWVNAGHDVTVITCVPNVPNGVPYEGYRNRFRSQRETIDGINVIRVWTFLAPNSGFARRILNYLSYMVTAVIAGLFVKRPQVVIATSPQFFCGWAGVIVQFLRRLPFVLEIRDIWPESVTAVGAIKVGFVIRLFEWLEKKMYRSADQIVTVGKGYRDNVASKVDVGDRISVIYNGVDGDQFAPQPADAEFRRRYGMQDRFLCSYVGTIGMAHGLETVLNAAEILKEAGRDDIGFLLVGDGARREWLEQDAADRGLSDLVKFTGRLDKSEMPGVISSSDTLLVHLRQCDLFTTVIPSKIFETMAMQRPIIMGVRGESAEIVERAVAGIQMEPGNVDSLLNCLDRLSSDRELYESLTSNGRRFVLEEFSRDTFAADYLKVFATLVPDEHDRSTVSVGAEVEV
ncbi:MAG: glycosyltransferase family 4 protein [Fuerstiella sp.]|nr:glycosyltransferase family 4 protein [Fuerstiella sp.]